jgi:hypothetical protein
VNIDFDQNPSFIDLQNITWNQDSTALSNTSEIAILRLARFLNRNKNLLWYLTEPNTELLKENKEFLIDDEVNEDDWPVMWEEDVQDTEIVDEILTSEIDVLEADSINNTTNRQTLVNFVYTRLESYGLHADEPIDSEDQISSKGAYMRLFFRQKNVDSFKFE